MSDFYPRLNRALQHANFALPTLLISKTALDTNIAALKHLLPSHVTPRIVVKSLPSVALIRYISSALQCQHFMVFHQPHLALILDAFPTGDILLGKPMPVAAVAQFYHQHPQHQAAPVQWLVDSAQRLALYLQLAQQQRLRLLLNIEIDIGLHRGGVTALEQFRAMLTLIAAHPAQLTLSGLMGYDAHVGKIPKLIKSARQSYQTSQQRYQRYLDTLQQDFSALYHPALCLNGAGSPTLSMHSAHSVCNDLSFGSMLLKPTDFDLPTLAAFQPAVWIATPVLKKSNQTHIPELSLLDRLYRGQQALFIYGGYWMADYVYPLGAKPNPLYGRSSNQELINVPKDADIQVDDFVFLRPTQSEAVISQFEQIWFYADGAQQADFTAWATFRAA